jgi:hypothetical protein
MTQRPAYPQAGAANAENKIGRPTLVRRGGQGWGSLKATTAGKMEPGTSPPQRVSTGKNQERRIKPTRQLVVEWSKSVPSAAKAALGGASDGTTKVVPLRLPSGRQAEQRSLRGLDMLGF